MIYNWRHSHQGLESTASSGRNGTAPSPASGRSDPKSREESRHTSISEAVASSTAPESHQPEQSASKFRNLKLSALILLTVKLWQFADLVREKRRRDFTEVSTAKGCR